MRRAAISRQPAPRLVRHCVPLTNGHLLQTWTANVMSITISNTRHLPITSSTLIPLLPSLVLIYLGRCMSFCSIVLYQSFYQPHLSLSYLTQSIHLFLDLPLHPSTLVHHSSSHMLCQTLQYRLISKNNSQCTISYLH
jgi:hypothetical protein